MDGRVQCCFRSWLGNWRLTAFVFAVDASAAGEGQLEIAITAGRALVPNKVEVLGGGKCLVTFTPQTAQPHFIDVKFNGEQVTNLAIGK